jgi:GNAT superfamily N-acetyltransferase
MVTFDELVHLAHGDAWQVEGRLRERFGGGALELDGARLSASGLPHPQWNNGDLVDPARFDLAAVRAWFAERAFGAGVPWGMRVPAGKPFPHGRFLFAQRCMALSPAQFVAARPPAAVTIGESGTHDLDTVARIDAAAFGEKVEQILPWIAPHIGAQGFKVALARLDGEAVGIATAVSTDARAGRCVGIFGVGVLERARGRGIGAALSAWLLERAFDAGATLAHLTPNTDAAARVYARLGFLATAGFDVYADL